MFFAVAVAVVVAIFICLVVGSKLLPAWLKDIPLQRNIGFKVACVVGVVVLLFTLLEILQFAHGLSVIGYLYTPIVCLPLVIWHLSVQWGVMLSGRAAPRQAHVPCDAVPCDAVAEEEGKVQEPRSSSSGDAGPDDERAAPRRSQF